MQGIIIFCQSWFFLFISCVFLCTSLQRPLTLWRPHFLCWAKLVFLQKEIYIDILNRCIWSLNKPTNSSVPRFLEMVTLFNFHMASCCRDSVFFMIFKETELWCIAHNLMNSYGRKQVGYFFPCYKCKMKQV